MVRALQPADPRLIGPYRLVGQLGAGGMGRVFLAMSAGGRPVAVKMIRAELAADPDFRSRFSREVSAARRVNGLFTALVVDADVDAQVPWLATAYVAGPSLAETVKEHGPLSAKSVLALAAGLAEGLNAIHAAGVVHGDLKPSNVLLAEDGPRVIDFGISHAAETAPLTHPGLVMGSPGFMSPEQALGKKVGPLSDVFSLGAVLAFAASGERPFGTGTPIELLDRVIHGTPSLDKVPAEVRPLVERCLAKDPSQRPTAASLLAELGALQAATDWLPDSIMRMFPRDLSPKVEDDRKGGSTLTVTMGSAAQDAAVLPRHARPSAPAKPNDQQRTDVQPRPGDRMPPTDQRPPDAGAQRDARAQRNDRVQPGDRVPARDPRQPGGQLQPADQRAVADSPPADDQLRRDDQVQTGDQPLLADQAETGDQLRPDDRVRSDGQTQAVDQLEPDDQLVPGDQPQWGDSGRKPRGPLWQLLAAACVVGGLLAACGAVDYALITATRHSAQRLTATTPALTSASPPALPRTASAPLDVTRVYTYQQGATVYVDIYYTGQSNNANGFGFKGVDGSPIAEVNYPFSSPGAGIVETGTITYPFNQGCGTAQQRSDFIEVWVTDAAGKQSAPSKPVHLACGP
jgi:serine/threonine protein kinase